MKYCLLSLTFILLVNLGIAQPGFQMTIDIGSSDDLIDVTRTAGGDFVVVGNVYSGSDFDIVLLRLSSTGTIIDSKKIGTSKNEVAKSVCTLSDGGFLITGYDFASPNDNDALVIRTDSMFNIIFYKSLGIVGGNDYANEGFETSPGSYYFTGTVAIGGSAKPSIVALNDSGQVVHQSYLNTNMFASPNYKGTYLGDGLIGFSNLSNIVSLLDTNGAIVKNFSLTYGGYTSQVIKTIDNQFGAIGFQFGSGSGATSSFIKMDSTGAGIVTIAPEFQINGSDLNPKGIIQDAGGNYYVAANLVSLSTGNGEPVVIKIDVQGQLLWAKKYSPPGVTDCQINCIIATDSGFVIGGYSGPFGSTNMFFALADSSGNTNCNATVISAAVNHITASASTPHSINGGTIDTLAAGAITITTPAPVSSMLCSPNGIHDAGFENSIDVYPTVFKNEISVEADASVSRIQMLDIFGRLVLDKIISGNEKIETENFQSGIYLLIVRDAKKEIVATRKLFKVE